MTDPKPPVLSVEVPLSRYGGGFAGVDLIPQASFKALAQRGSDVVVSGTRVDATLDFQPVNLPTEPVGCVVTWTSGTVSFPGTGQIDVGAKTIKVSFDITSSEAIGALLETNAGLTVHLDTDYIYCEKIPTVSLRKPLPKLYANVTWGNGQQSLFCELAGAKPSVLLGDVLKFKLERAGFWRCPVRLRIGYNVGQQFVEAFINFDGDTIEWPVGFDQGGILPVTPDEKNNLWFHLRLQASTDGKEYRNFTTYVSISVPRPVLKTFWVEIGKKAGEVLDAGKMPLIQWFGDDYAIRVRGQIDNLSSRTQLPLWLELWGYHENGFMHPLGVLPVRVPNLDAQGAFPVPITEVKTDLEIQAIKGWNLFAVLRAGRTDPLPVLPAAISYGNCRLFSDDDFAVNVPARGICSNPITKDTKATREPVLGAVAFAIDDATVVFSCMVHGSPATWKGAKPTFVLRATNTYGGAQVVQDVATYQATYTPIANTAQGRLIAAVAFDDAGKMSAIAKKWVTVRAEAGMPATSLIAGNTVTFETTPRITAVHWKFETKAPQHVHFQCDTSFFPRGAGWTFVLAVQTSETGSAPWKDEALGNAATTKTAADGTVHFRIYNEALVARLVAHLRAQRVRVKVSRPSGYELLFGNPDLAVQPWEGAPQMSP